MAAYKEDIFLWNCWYVAAWDHELLDGRKLARTILEKPVVLYQGESGRVVALDDRCCHRGAPLSMGRIEGDCSSRVVERDHLVWIWMGDPAKGDPGLIVAYPPLHDAGWRGLPGYLHYDANWLLIVDNLSDFAHLAFVHTKTLGGSEEYAYKTRPASIERLQDGFRAVRWHMNSDPPPFHKKVIPNKTDPVDRRNIGHMTIPGIFFLESLFAPAGSGAEKGNLAGAREYRNCQFMTPETRRTTHFFWNYLHNFDLDNPNIALSLRHSLEEGFLEDKGFIEAQQKLLDADPDFKLLAIGADAALSHFRWLMKERIAAERAPAQAAAA